MRTSGRRGAKRPRPKRGRSRKDTARASITLIVDDETWASETSVIPLVRRAAKAGLAACKTRARHCTVLLTNDARSQELNRTFRGKDRATNVLSFPAGRTGYLGDVAIAFGVATHEARAQNKPFAHHAAHLALHGVLHLLGYDHERENEARVMERLEAQILARLGVTDPYLGRKAA